MANRRSYFLPEDIAFMRDALREWCVIQHVERDSPEATMAAITLVGLMEEGLARAEVLEALTKKSAMGFRRCA